MPFSAFTPWGLFRFSGEKPLAERIYDATIESFGGQYAEGGRQHAFAYAAAICAARAQRANTRAARQRLPMQVSESEMSEQEAEYDLHPEPGDTLPVRRAALAYAAKAKEIGTEFLIESELQTALGAAFVGLRIRTVGESAASPSAAGAQPMNLVAPGTRRKVARTTTPVSLLGAGSVSYAPEAVPLVPTEKPAPQLYVAGDRIVVSPETPGCTETVVVTSATSTQFVATFTKPHHIGSLLTTQVYPAWRSTKRHVVVAVTPAAALLPSVTSAVNRIMSTYARASTTWSIAQATGGSTVSFKVGEAGVGISTIGTISV